MQADYESSSKAHSYQYDMATQEETEELSELLLSAQEQEVGTSEVDAVQQPSSSGQVQHPGSATSGNTHMPPL